MGFGFRAIFDSSIERAEAWLMVRSNGKKRWFGGISSCAGEIDAIVQEKNHEFACLLVSQVVMGLYNLHLILDAPIVAMPDCR